MTTKSKRMNSNDENVSEFQPLAPAWRAKRQEFLQQARLAKTQRPSSREVTVEVLVPATKN